MALLLRKSDRVQVKVEDLSLEIAPLSFAAKMEINEVIGLADQNDVNASMKAAKIAMGSSIKGLKGVECLDGEEYKLEFIGDKLSDECIDDLLNLEACPKIMSACMALIGGVSEEIIDPVTGKKLEGVEVKLPKKLKAKK